jgi:Mor family transcriptional regulator
MDQIKGSLQTEFKNLIDNMTVDEMPTKDLADVAELCGTNIAISLLKNMKGVNIYIPGQQRFKCVIEKFVINKFDGSNAKKLAMICEISINHVYEIVQRENKRRGNQRNKLVHK